MGLSLWAIWITLKHLPHCVGDFSLPVWFNQCQGVKETSGDSTSKHPENGTFHSKERFQDGIVGHEASEVQLAVLSPAWKESRPLWHHQGFIGQNWGIITDNPKSETSNQMYVPHLNLTPLGQGEIPLVQSWVCMTCNQRVWGSKPALAFCLCCIVLHKHSFVPMKKIQLKSLYAWESIFVVGW